MMGQSKERQELKMIAHNSCQQPQLNSGEVYSVHMNQNILFCL